MSLVLLVLVLLLLRGSSAATFGQSRGQRKREICLEYSSEIEMVLKAEFRNRIGLQGIGQCCQMVCIFSNQKSHFG
jgi:hypothetical protein